MNSIIITRKDSFIYIDIVECISEQKYTKNIDFLTLTYARLSAIFFLKLSILLPCKVASRQVSKSVDSDHQSLKIYKVFL